MNQPHSTNRSNRLAKESSPYLQQHQYNPVDWYPWGPEAFEAARRLDKPIFLSVGYSTCYWCHVMERQCFEDQAIAAVMNELFINIKVDREERPDVDSLYMTAVQVLTQHGGWPMSVFLTPDLRPFYGGTYFPPQDMHGRPGFPTVLRSIEDAFHNRSGDVEKSASQLITILENLAQPPVPKQPVRIDLDFVEAQIKGSIYDYDAIHGGFGGAPKFPRQTLLQLMLIHQRSFPDEHRMKMIRHTLDAMANGGIRDHLGGAFHRYSTDRQWLVPHFEIMLYDNAMLAWCYTEAFKQTGEARYADVTKRILDFVLREMTSPEGAFYTAIDAEVDAQEGLNYLWTKDELESVFGAEASTAFCKLYGLDEGSNFVDPHHGNGVPDKNILFLKSAEGENDPGIIASREKLYQHRAKRKQPLLDTKILTSWNGLMIRAFAYAGQILNETRYIEAAARAAKYLLEAHQLPSNPGATKDNSLSPRERAGVRGRTGIDDVESPVVVSESSSVKDSSQAEDLPHHAPSPQPSPSGRGSRSALARTSRDGVAKFFGFLDDYAFLAQACLAIADATNDPSWRDEATTLATEMKARFGDPDVGGFFFTDKAAIDLPVRQKIASDSPLPLATPSLPMSCNSLAMVNLLAASLQPLQKISPHKALE